MSDAIKRFKERRENRLIDRANRGDDEEFESKHPRGHGGKFAKKGSGGIENVNKNEKKSRIQSPLRKAIRQGDTKTISSLLDKMKPGESIVDPINPQEGISNTFIKNKDGSFTLTSKNPDWNGKTYSSSMSHEELVRMLGEDPFPPKYKTRGKSETTASQKEEKTPANLKRTKGGTTTISPVEALKSALDDGFEVFNENGEYTSAASNLAMDIDYWIGSIREKMGPEDALLATLDDGSHIAYMPVEDDGVQGFAGVYASTYDPEDGEIPDTSGKRFIGSDYFSDKLLSGEMSDLVYHRSGNDTEYNKRQGRSLPQNKQYAMQEYVSPKVADRNKEKKNR